MAAIRYPAKFAAITDADATGYVTVASVVGWPLRAVVCLTVDNDSAGDGMLCEIVDIIAADNKIGLRALSAPGSVALKSPTYNRVDVTAYDGGLIAMDEQDIYIRSS